MHFLFYKKERGLVMSDIALYNKYINEMCIECKNRTTELCHIVIVPKINFINKKGTLTETYKSAKCVYYDKK
jgi:hypothetical protein